MERLPFAISRALEEAKEKKKLKDAEIELQEISEIQEISVSR